MLVRKKMLKTIGTTVLACGMTAVLSTCNSCQSDKAKTGIKEASRKVEQKKELVLDRKTDKKNILFFLIDDMGWKDLTCYGSTSYQTPNIDKLADGGVRFTHAYTLSPVCSPTRASLMTGKNPARLQITDWLKGNKWKHFGMRNAKQREHLPLEENTIAEELKEEGYVTGNFGKWHLGGEGFLPEDQGFDVNVGGNHMGHPESFFVPYGIDNLPDGPEGEYITDRITDEAIQFMEKYRNDPFFLYMSHYAVHDTKHGMEVKESDLEFCKKYFESLDFDKLKKYAIEVNPDMDKSQVFEEDKKLFDPQGKIEMAQLEDFRQFREKLPYGAAIDKLVQDSVRYAAMVRSLDENVGRLMERLKELGLEKDTIVVFYSDNGGVSNFFEYATSNYPLRNGKGWLTEGGMRVPCIIKWPGVTESKVSDQIITSADFFPTLLEMAGGKVENPEKLDGKSIVPFLKSGKKVDHGPILWHFPHYSVYGGEKPPSSAIRVGDYKLVKYYQNKTLELFNVEEDIREENNLAQKMPEKVKEMHQLLKKTLAEMDAQMPGGYKSN